MEAASSSQEPITGKDKKMKLMKSSSNEDLISELPDTLLHHILSFLDMYYVVRTSILSKRWRHLWTSLPFLNFNEEVYNPYNMARDWVTPVYEDFADFVDKVLFLYNGSNVYTFRLCCENYTKRISRRVSKWILFAVERNVEELDLQMNFASTYLDLPLCLFTCKSLTTLKFDMGTQDYPMLFYLPDVIALPSLKTLHLTSLFFMDEENIESFFSRCPILETLIISICMLSPINALTISALHLKNLEIDAFYVDDFYPSDCCKIRVSAPNLISFKCRDYMLNDYSLLNISSLVKADIDKVLDSHVSTETKKIEESKNLMKCLTGLYNIRSLTLSAWLLEVASDVHADLESVLPAFPNLTFLKLKTSLSRDQSRAIIYFLDNCPNVETLILEIIEVKVNSGIEVKIYEEEFPLQCRLDHLKFVEIQGMQGNKNEEEFLKFLLKNAMVLESMIACTSEEQSPTSDGRLKRLSEELEHFGKPPLSIEHVGLVNTSCERCVYTLNFSTNE